MANEPRSDLQLTPHQLRLLKTVWGGKRTAGEIRAAIQDSAGPPPDLAMVSAGLQQLAQEGYLQRELHPHADDTYTALVTAAEVREWLLSRSNDLLNEPAGLLERFAGRNDLSRERIRLRRILDSLEKPDQPPLQGVKKGGK